MYENELKELGLTDNEIKIYLILLKNETSNPSEISEKASLHRGYVYDTLQRMQEKGFVKQVLIKNKKNFQAEKPSQILKGLKTKLKKFEKIVPELESISSSKDENTAVQLNKGDVYLNLLNDINQTKTKEVYLTGINQEEYEKFKEVFKAKKIKYKTILKKDSVKNQEIVQLIYEDKTAIITPGNNPNLIIIKNKDLAESNKKQFNLLRGTAS